MRALLRREMQPRENLLDPLSVGKAGIELQIVTGTNALNLRFGAYPKERSGAHTLLHGQNPQRSSSVPGAVCDRLGIVIAVRLFASRVVKAVGHDAVMARIEAGNDGVVVRKCDGWKRGKHAFGRAGTLSGQRKQMFGMKFPGVVVAKSIQ